jgi:hypothetical protein
MVGSWPCKVSYEIHIDGRRVSEPVREGKGKMMATEPEDEKDPKRAHAVMSRGHEVVRPGYSRLLGDAARVTYRREESGNPSLVHQEHDTDRRTNQVTRDSQSDQDEYSGRRAG